MMIRHFGRMLGGALLLAVVAPLPAQTPSTADATARIGAAAAEVRAIDGALDDAVDADARSALATRIETARASAIDTATVLEAQLALIDARIAELGPVPADAAEAPDIQAQRRLLGQQRATIDSAIKRGRLVGVEAKQLADEIAATRTEQINAELAARSASPASPEFWNALIHAFPRDATRTMRLIGQGADGVVRGARQGHPWIAGLALLLALILQLPIRLALRRAGQRRMIAGAPGHRVRRSGYALWRVTIGTALPGLAAFALSQGLRWAGMVAPGWNAILGALVPAALISGFIAALGGALLMRGQASWRLLPIGDIAAERLRPWTWLLAGLAFVLPLVDAFGAAAGASAAATALVDMTEAALHVLLLIGVLVTIGGLRAARVRDTSDDDSPVHAGVALATLATWGLVIACLVALLAGYIGASLFLARIVAWATLVGSALYLLLVATDDVATTVLSGDSRLGRALHRGMGLRRSAIDQFGVLVSGLLRLFLTLVAVSMLLAPFGAGVGSLFDRLGVLAQGVTIGQVNIAPGAILRSILVFAVGLTLVRLFQRWLTTRYLPTTEMDGSARNSVSLVARYIGLLLATLWGLASLGIGIERIALLLSALSVGIGFGLQAITQNFVSGLILLAERPVKIGDLVRIGADEGDVKRISVRSTEIELADHSTLIVPNSELITKTVLNKTLANPLGRIQLQFSVPLGSDAGHVRALVLETFAMESAVLDDPAPHAFIDGIADGRILFNCFAHVAGPREVYPARSAVLLELLARFQHEGIDVGTVAQRLELAPGVGERLGGGGEGTA